MTFFAIFKRSTQNSVATVKAKYRNGMMVRREHVMNRTATFAKPNSPPPPNKSFLSPSKYKRICLNDSEVLFVCLNLTNVICSDIKYCWKQLNEGTYLYVTGIAKLNNLYCKKQTSANGVNSEISTKIIFTALGFLLILILRIYTKKTTRIKGV
jgi:hypothetical protein